MYYDPTKPERWRWIPRNVRHDKTAQLRNGDDQYGNSFGVAQNIWQTYHNPITVKMIGGQEDIPDQLEEDTRYYARFVGREKSLSRAMLDFHNLCAKKKLICGVASDKPQGSLLDLACGKAGDLPKWVMSGLQTIVGVDVSQDNIENSMDGACVRYHQYRQKQLQQHKKPISCYFLVGDSGKNIASGEASGKLPDYQNLARILWGNVSKSKIDSVLRKIHGVAKAQFDIVSVQFALHYFFVNGPTLLSFLQNVCQNTKIGGYFIGTCFDGEMVFDRLKNLRKGQSIQGYLPEQDSVLWKIKKNYNLKTFNADKSSLGTSVSVYMETINQYFEEYLIHFQYLQKLMENHGFHLLSVEEAQNVNMPSGTGTFQDLYHNLEKEVDLSTKTMGGSQSKETYGLSLHLSKIEKEISFLYRWFIFRKDKEVSKFRLDRLRAPGEKEPTEHHTQKHTKKKKTLLLRKKQD